MLAPTDIWTIVLSLELVTRTMLVLFPMAIDSIVVNILDNKFPMAIDSSRERIRGTVSKHFHTLSFEFCMYSFFTNFQPLAPCSFSAHRICLTHNVLHNIARLPRFRKNKKIAHLHEVPKLPGSLKFGGNRSDNSFIFKLLRGVPKLEKCICC